MVAKVETFSTSHPFFTVEKVDAEEATFAYGEGNDDYKSDVLTITADSVTLIEGDLDAFAASIDRALNRTNPLEEAARNLNSRLGDSIGDLAIYFNYSEAEAIARVAKALGDEDGARRIMTTWATVEESTGEPVQALHGAKLLADWNIEKIDNEWQHAPQEGILKPENRNVRVQIPELVQATAYYISDHRWNGWICPAFERHEVERIAAQMEKSDHRDNQRITFDAENDRVIATHTFDGETETDYYEGTVLADGTKVYWVGAWAWVWEKTSR